MSTKYLRPTKRLRPAKHRDDDVRVQTLLTLPPTLIRHILGFIREKEQLSTAGVLRRAHRAFSHAFRLSPLRLRGVYRPARSITTLQAQQWVRSSVRQVYYWIMARRCLWRWVWQTEKINPLCLELGSIARWWSSSSRCVRNRCVGTKWWKEASAAHDAFWCALGTSSPQRLAIHRTCRCPS